MRLTRAAPLPPLYPVEQVTSLTKAHQSPVTALCAVPSLSAGGSGRVAGFLSGSKDMTARLWRLAGSGR